MHERPCSHFPVPTAIGSQVGWKPGLIWQKMCVGLTSRHFPLVPCGEEAIQGLPSPNPIKETQRSSLVLTSELTRDTPGV